MRFSADICFKGSPPFRIPVNYRRNIASLIKEGVRRADPDLYSELWGSNKTKPFTFSVFISHPVRVTDGKKSFFDFEEDHISLWISSADDSLLIKLYNSLLNISGKYSMFDKNSGIEGFPELKHFRLGKEPYFTGESVTFRLMSPMIIRNFDYVKGNRKEGVAEYLYFDDPAFFDNFYHSVLHECRNFFSEKYQLLPEDLFFEPANLKKVRVYHYNETVSAVSGTFSLKAPADVQKLIYNAGLGARKSQGFGMTEVVK